MDADLELDAELFETLERAFVADPQLGIAGARLSGRDKRARALVPERCPPQHVRGATKFYRRACLEQIAPLEPILGWDTIDEIAARKRGWRTESLSAAGAHAVHLRPTGSSDGLLRAQHRWGACAYSSASTRCGSRSAPRDASASVRDSSGRPRSSSAMPAQACAGARARRPGYAPSDAVSSWTSLRRRATLRGGAQRAIAA